MNCHDGLRGLGLEGEGWGGVVCLCARVEGVEHGVTLELI